MRVDYVVVIQFIPTNVLVFIAGTIIVCVKVSLVYVFVFAAFYNHSNDHLKIAVHLVYYENNVANGIDNDEFGVEFFFRHALNSKNVW